MSTPHRPPNKRQREQAARLQQMAQPPWWQSPRALGGGALALVAAIVVLVAVAGRSGDSSAGAGASGTPLPAAVFDAVTKPAPSLFDTVGGGGQPSHLAKLPGTTTRTDSNGKSSVVYVGAEYCPFCAGERWGLTMALARFGTFTNLRESSSSPTDAFPNTSTLTFHGSTFSSRWVSFEPVELQDGAGRPLESPSAQVAQIFSTFDQPPYTSAARGLPFLEVGGRFVLAQTSFSPQVLQGKNWEAVGRALADPGDPIAQAVVGAANDITASICIATGNQPAAVCTSAAIVPIERSLSAQTAPAGAAVPNP